MGTYLSTSKSGKYCSKISKAFSTPLLTMFMPIASPVELLKRRYNCRPANATLICEDEYVSCCYCQLHKERGGRRGGRGEGTEETYVVEPGKFASAIESRSNLIKVISSGDPVLELSSTNHRR